MACPGGCVAGAGTMQPIAKSAASVGIYAKKAPVELCCDTPYLEDLDDILEEEGL